MSTWTVTYAFPASLNFILYIWRLRAHSQSPWPTNAHGAESDAHERFARVWQQERNGGNRRAWRTKKPSSRISAN